LPEQEAFARSVRGFAERHLAAGARARVQDDGFPADSRAAAVIGCGGSAEASPV